VDVFAVLAEPHRRSIVDHLGAHDGASVGDLVTLLGLTQPAVSKHLRILRDVGLVRSDPQGQRRIYRLDPTPLRAVDDWLAPYRRRWIAALDRLERHLGDRP